MSDNAIRNNPRVIVVQKLYAHHLNKYSEITFPKHRYKKFIKDIVMGTIEREELIQSLIDKELKEATGFLSSTNKTISAQANCSRVFCIPSDSK